MKNLLVLIMLLLWQCMLMAQNDNTLFNNHTRNGFFVAPIFEYSEFEDDIATSMGGGFGFITGDFFFGAYGLGLADYDNAFDDGIDELTLGHGGLWIGYTYPQTQVIHLFSSIKGGWGGVNFEFDDGELDYDDSFMVLTPELGLEFNVFRWFRIAATGGYRFLEGFDQGSTTYSEADFEGWTGTLTLRIGGFGRDRGKSRHYYNYY